MIQCSLVYLLMLLREKIITVDISNLNSQHVFREIKSDYRVYNKS